PLRTYKHSVTAQQLWLRLRDVPEQDRVYLYAGYKLAAGSFVQPDLSVAHADQAVQKYLIGAPAIAIEVVAPTDTCEAVSLKTRLYFQYGAREVWRIYLRTRHVT